MEMLELGRRRVEYDIDNLEFLEIQISWRKRLARCLLTIMDKFVVRWLKPVFENNFCDENKLKRTQGYESVLI